MDRDQRTDWRHTVVDPKKTNSSMSGTGSGSDQPIGEPAAKQRTKGTQSKFNRILGNLERSILSQFNHSDKGNADTANLKRRPATTNAKRKQIIHPCQQQQANPRCANTSDADTSLSACNNPMSLDSQTASNAQLQHRLHEEVSAARRQHPTSRDRITSTLKGMPVVRPSSEKIGKLTLNSKGQPTAGSPRQPASLCPSLATNRLSIPPPHANDEARSLNPTLLFGSGAAPISPSEAAVQQQQQHHHQQQQPLLDTARQGSCSATMNTNTTSREAGQSRLGADRLFAEQQQHSINRLSSSPATSARSLPVVGPKPGSQTSRLSDAQQPKTTLNQQDEEESGFALYQSRRSVLKSSPQRQASSDESSGQEKMILNRMNYFTNLHASGHQAAGQFHHPVHSNHIMTNQQHQNNMMLVPNEPINRYTQAAPMTLSSANQVPIVRNSTNGMRHNGYNGIQRVPPIQNSHIYNHNQDQKLLFQLQQQQHQQHQQGNFLDNSQQLQVQRMTEQQQHQLTDNGQQIYANAPPKPRRYQYYDGLMPVSQVTSEPPVTASQVTSHQMSVSANNSAIMALAPIARQPNLQSNHQLVFNLPGQMRPPQTTYSSMLLSGISMGQPTSTGATNSRLNAQYSCEGHMHAQQRFNRYDQGTSNQPQGFLMLKSKSSLEADDIARYKHNRQMQIQAAQNYMQQPTFGYRQAQESMQQGVNIQQSASHSHHIRLQNQAHAAQNGNLQRSKSVTHLLPESVGDNHCGAGQLKYQDQARPFAQGGLSSASTTHLEHVGFDLNSLHSNHLQRDRSHVADKMHPSNTREYMISSLVPTQRQPAMVVGLGADQHARQTRAHNALLDNASGNGIMANQSQFYRARSMAALNNESALTSKIIRHSPGQINVSQEGAGFRKPSLDDQIKHLLISGYDNAIVPQTIQANGSTSANNRDSGSVYQVLDAGNRPAFGMLPASLSSLGASRMPKGTSAPATWAKNGTSDQTNANLFHEPQTANATGCSGPSGTLNHIESKPQAVQQPQSRISASNLSLAELGSNMGNRQSRQYRPGQVAEAQVGSQNTRRQSDANSQLIVDLTTPRVLAKTQTTLLHAGVQSSDSWSINQVGLPQMSPAMIVSTTTTSQTTDAQTKAARPVTTTEDGAAREKQQSNHAASPASADQGQDNGNRQTSSSERSAPYYYSDLKSREQREALRNIVQQKSLSPPPQLLSRSTDQSSTRLALRSATLHPGHARTLSDNLAQRQRDTGPSVAEARGDPGRSHLVDSNSTANIAKNIDKLFERPLDRKSSIVTPIAQSMLSLADNNIESRHSNHVTSHAPHSSNLGAIETKGLTGEPRTKNISKSKSLENISQKSTHDDHLAVKCSTNPVYENIRCSNKLLNAINDSAVGFSNGDSSVQAGMKIVAVANAISDESMDSILGSSLDDSDSCSDIIDEIKISSTDNHLHDISNLIEQLKTNQSKMAEEYKSTLVRIAKTINSKQDESKNNEKLARRLQLLELKSKKCESRSKNQLALIQMMEKVLRQSRLRAMSNRSSITTSQQATSVAANNISDTGKASPTSGLDSIASASDASGSGAKQSSASSGLVVSSLGEQPTTDERTRLKQVALGGEPAQSGSATQHEIIKAIVVEKEAKSAVKSKATVNNSTNPPIKSKSEPQSPEKVQVADGTRSTKSSAVAQRVLDIEARNQGDLGKDKKNSDKTSPSNSNTGNSNDDSNSSSGQTSNANKHSGDLDQDDDDDGDDNNSLQDDEDFIEFLSNDIANHRSQFEASQFSVSDFNASTSASESSASCGAVNDSLNSLRPASRSSQSKDKSELAPMTNGILKNRRNSYEGTSSPAARRGGSPATRKGVQEEERTSSSSHRGAHEKFKNVLGNVVDVDICPMNNLSQGCSPVNNQPKTPCLS